ncbi:MAG: hypothetical protein GY742_17240 [Hyphomicrobiales bacterium]|nr:hypothetical protein [Hyphomicrobiales bacterium]
MSEFSIDRDIGRPKMQVLDEAAIENINMNKRCGAFHMQHDNNLTADQGERIMIAGLSRSEKSMLIRLLNAPEEFFNKLNSERIKLSLSRIPRC